MNITSIVTAQQQISHEQLCLPESLHKLLKDNPNLHIYERISLNEKPLHQLYLILKKEASFFDYCGWIFSSTHNNKTSLSIIYFEEFYNFYFNNIHFSNKEGKKFIETEYYKKLKNTGILWNTSNKGTEKIAKNNSTIAFNNYVKSEKSLLESESILLQIKNNIISHNPIIAKEYDLLLSLDLYFKDIYLKYQSQKKAEYKKILSHLLDNL